MQKILLRKKMGMSHQIGMYDFNGNKIVVIEVNPKIAWIRIPEDGSYMTLECFVPEVYVMLLRKTNTAVPFLCF